MTGRGLSPRPWRLDELAEAVGASPIGDLSTTVWRVATLKDATPDSIALYHDARFSRHLQDTAAAVVVLNEAAAGAYSGNCLVARNPRAVFAEVVKCLHEQREWRSGVDPSASVSPDASVDASASVGACAVIEGGARVSSNVFIGNGAVIGAGVQIGEETSVDGNVTIYDGCEIGDRCRIFAGVVIGAPGFSYERDEGRWVRLPNIGSVVIGDDVDIGAAVTIDRGSIEHTVIGDGVKIDSNVHIGHNVICGDDTVIAANAGIGGSAVIGSRCTIGGHVAVRDHASIADDVTILGGTVVTKSIDAAGTYASCWPAQPANIWWRTLARLRLILK